MIIDNPIVSGSLNVQNNVTASYGLITNDLTVQGTINATIQGTSATASYVQYSGVANKPSLISGSQQIATEISGAFDWVSSSLASRITSQEDFSSSLDATFATDSELSEISGALASSISSISTDFADIQNKPTLLSGSNQIQSDISGSFTQVSSSFAADRLKNTTDTLTGDLTVTGTITAQEFHTEFVSASIIYQSGSTQFGDSLDDTHLFTGSINLTGSLKINGSEVGTGKLDETIFNSYTSSTDTRLDTLEGKTLLSSSAQIASEISGAYTDTSSSLAQRITNQEDFSSSLDATFATDQQLTDVSGALALSISSISTDFADITNKPTLISSSVQIAADISGSFTQPSGSFSTRVTSLENFSSSLDATFATDSELTAASGALASTISDIIDGTITVVSASNAITASYALNAGAGAGFPFSGSAVITGSLYVSQSYISGSFRGDGSQLSNISVSQVNTVTASFAATSSVTILHSFNSKNVSVNVYDDSDILLIPQQVTLVDNNNVKIDFGGSTSGFAVVAKGGHIVSGSVVVPELSTVADSFTSASSHTVAHNFNTKNVIVSVYENDSLIIPDTVTIDDFNNITVSFPEAISGRVVVVKAGHIVSGSINYNNILDKPTLISSSIQIGSDISGSFTSVSGSVATRLTDLETFEANIDNTYATDSDVSAVSTRVTNLEDSGLLSSSIQIGSDISGSFTETSASIALDLVSNYLRNTTDTLTGDLTVTGRITAQEFHSEYVSASITYASGSHKFGDSLDDVHEFTGSVFISGSGTFRNTGPAHFLGGNVGIGTTTANDSLQIETGAENTTGGLRLNRPGSYYQALEFSTNNTVDWSVGQNSTNSFEVFEDGLALSTRFTINQGGNVGIGTTTPAQKLHVQGTRADIQVESTYATQATRYILKTTSHEWRIGTNSTQNDSLWFYDADGSSYRMSLTTGGSLGIGTTAPKTKLQIDDTADFSVALSKRASTESAIKFTLSDPTATDFTWKIAHDTVEDLSIYGYSADNFRIWTNATERFTVAADGNVGIGTNSPGTILDIRKANTGEHVVRVWNSDSSGTGISIIRAANSGNTDLGSQLQMTDATYYVGTITADRTNGMRFYVGQQTNPTQSARMSIKTDGNVGIGVINDVRAKLHLNSVNVVPVAGAITDDSNLVISGQDGNMDLFSTDDNTTVTTSIGLGRYHASTGALIHKFGIVGWANIGSQGSNTGNKIAFHYGTNNNSWANSELMHIGANGNVGVGTTAANAPFDVQSGVRMGRGWHLTGRAGIRLDSDGTSRPADILFGHTAAGNETSWNGVYWSLSSRANSAGNKFYFYRGTGQPSPYNSEAVLMSFDPSMKVGINTESPTQALHVHGNVYASGNSQAANAVMKTYSNHAMFGSNSSVVPIALGRDSANLDLVIDTGGRVLKQYQTSFVAYSSAQITLSTGDAVLTLGNEAFDTGGQYNTSTYRFTAPVDGKYLFTFTASVNALGGGIYNAVYIKVNGNGTSHRFRAPGNLSQSTWGGIVGSAILSLSANDYVELSGYTESGTITLQANEARWCGYLLG